MKNTNFIEITTNMGCKNDCIYCPQHTLLSKYFKEDKTRKSEMTLADFKLALNHIPKNIHILFTGMSEPFQAKDCIDMILYAANNDYKVIIHTTLRNLEIEDIDKLVHDNILWSLVHLPDADGLLKLNVDEEYIEKVKKYKKVLKDKAKWMVIGNVHPEIQKCFEGPLWTAPIVSRGNNLDKNKIPKNVKIIETDETEIAQGTKIICKRRFENIVDGSPTKLNIAIILPDGTVVLCCNDYDMKHIIGNIYNQNYDEIINSEAMQRIEDSMICKNNDFLLCRNCEWACKYEPQKWKTFLKTGEYKKPKTLLQKIVSVNNIYSTSGKHKCLNICGVKFKFKCKA